MLAHVKRPLPSVAGQFEFVAASLPRQMAVPQGGTASTSN
jgi:hypothetical protein